MSEQHKWREMLAEIIKNPQEKQRIANALGVNQLTLTRWVRNISVPREAHLQKLRQVLPRLSPLLTEDFATLPSIPAVESADSIPITFYNHVLSLNASVPDSLRFWSICEAVLREAVQRLGSSGMDLDISVVRCLVPDEGTVVRCLREHIGLGTSPEKEQVGIRARFFGAESLAGYVVESTHSTVIADISKEQRLPHQLPENAHSAAASPILHAGRVAGCILATSDKPGYFSSLTLLHLLDTYATLLALAFDAREFYELQSIQLGIMPPAQVQDSYLADFQRRLNSLLKNSGGGQAALNYLQAEQRTWWQIAEELLGLAPRFSPEI